MNAVRRLFDDLVEKKLWPAALLLVITAIAVPLVIGGGGDGGAPPPDPTAALPPAAAAPAAVELVGPPAVRERAGAVRDPFRRAKVKAKADTSPAAAEARSKSAGSEGATSTAKKKSAGSATGTPETATTTPQATTPAIDPPIVAVSHSIYQTVVRFTRPGGVRERPLARLAVLGNPAGPALQYVGVSSSRKHAIFMLGPNATAAGDSACMVDPCRAIMLRRGEKLGVAVVGKDSVVRHYEVEVIGLRRLHMPSAAGAQAWRARVDPAGVAVLQTLAQDVASAAVLQRLRYATSTGTVSLLSAP
ncbi:MAG: hypothetical protein QOG56_1592 [Solirubrobacteraceae bacterium]|nr:hypothetical protein [Solirubrobacteraceae bacterium]